MIYRLYNTETKLYSKGGMYSSFNQVGKIWAKLSHVKSHLLQKYCNNLRYAISDRNRLQKHIDEYKHLKDVSTYEKSLQQYMYFDLDKAKGKKYYNSIPSELEVIEYDDNLVEIKRFNAKDLYPEYI